MKTVLFDLDGTLTDSAPGITACIRHALIALGRDAPEAGELGWCVGPPLAASLARLLGSDDRDLVAQALALYRGRFASIGYAENALYEGVPEAVAALRGAGYRTVVATSKPAPYAVKIVEHFAMGGLFDGIYGSGLDGTLGDKRELIAHVLRAERLDADRTIMVGDREHDAIGARHCGIACIGVAYGYGGGEELRASGVVALAAHPNEIPALVRRHLG